MGPHWFAVTRLSDNRLRGLMREIAELIDETADPLTLHNLRVSLGVLHDGAGGKAFSLSRGRIR